jgi:hypothetical protein
MLAEFEEKQYEQQLNIELLQGSNLLFPPGQVLENELGFDAALYTNNKLFWELYFLEIENFDERSYGPVVLPGAKLPIHLWSAIDQNIENYPKFKFNLFIQHKRPEFMKGGGAAERESWGASYYRYKTVVHQQRALSILADSMDGSGLVVYACPAFYRNVEFWLAVERRDFIKSSNFCEVRKLDRHHIYTYQKAGKDGVAHSDPEKIEGLDLMDKLSVLSDTNPGNGNRQHIAKLAKHVGLAMSESSEYSLLYRRITQSMASNYDGIPIALDLISIDVFQFLTKSKLFIGF